MQESGRDRGHVSIPMPCRNRYVYPEARYKSFPRAPPPGGEVDAVPAVLGALGALAVKAVAVPATKASAWGSARDSEVRQLVLEFRYAGVRDLRVAEIEPSELR